MIRALPVLNPGELVLFARSGPASKGSSSFPAAMWDEMRKHETGLAAVAAYGSTSVDLSRGGEARRVGGGFVSGSYFSLLGTRPVAGRLLGEGDDHPGCPPVAVITDAFWRTEYGASPSVVGASLALNGAPFEIVGVAEPSFFGMEIGYQPPIWAPLCTERIVRGAAGGGYRGGMGLAVVGRLAPASSIEQAGARVAAMAQAVVQTTGAAPNTTFALVPFSRGVRDLSRAYGDSLFALMAVVAVVLLIACANVANLLLARATARQREIAVRLALGAGRWRVVRQLLTESVLLSAFGAAAGVLFASWASRGLVRLLSPPGRLVALDLPLDPLVLTFTLTVSLLTGVLFGLAPAFRASRVDPHAAMRTGGRGALEGHTRFHAGKALVVAQIALSLVALSAAALLVGSWRRLATVDPGFRGDRVVVASADIRMAGIPDERQPDTYGLVLARLRAIPGVVAVSGSSRTPIDNVNWSSAIAFEDESNTGDLPVVYLNEVTDGYFAALGVPIRAGRDFTAADSAGSPRVAVISEELARRSGGAAAIGRRCRWQPGHDFSPAIETVGIAGDTKMRPLREASPPIVYLAAWQNARPGPLMVFAIRAARSAQAVIPDVKSAFAAVNPRISLRLTTLDRQVDDSLHLQRAMGVLSGLFGTLALALAALGLYGITSYNVARRRGEIGVRIALGAERSRIVRMVFGDVGRLVAVGLAIGVPLCLPVTRLITALLYGVTPGDPASMAVSIVILAAAAIAAALTPAARAACLDPIAALRED